jgi:hypothetical protein
VIDEKRLHYDLFRHCFRVMSAELKQYMCGLQHPGVGTTQFGGQSLNDYISPHLQYSCRYGFVHLLRNGRTIEEETGVVEFFEMKLLYWLETLGWMSKVAEAVQVITELGTSVVSNEPCEYVPYLTNL